MSTDTNHIDSFQRSGPSPAAIVLDEQGPMRLAIFGATGRTGSQLLEQALQAGHEVTAIVRNPDRLPTPAPAALRVVAADVMDAAAIARPAFPDRMRSSRHSARQAGSRAQ
jgi:nucleoside-diphosphate-sugar epimerase